MIMTPDHPLWDKFYDRLAGPEGCNFVEDATVSGGFRWMCTGGIDRPYARAILATYPDIDVEESLEYFSEHGGYCDCEILFNVEK